MRILAIDDEKMALAVLVDAINEVKEKEDEIVSFRDPKEAILYARENRIDVVFCDIRMKGMTGTDMALILKRINPKINIIFATGYSEYQTDAFNMHASGYLTKPISSDKVKIELENLRYPVEEDEKPGIFVKTFGNFDVFVNGKPISFKRTLAKEVLAYLVDKRGGAVSRQEISLLLFEDEEYSRKTQDYISKIIKSLQDSLKEAGCEEIFSKDRNSYFVKPDNFECDAYKYLAGDPKAINAFDGEYMEQYLWNEDCIDKFYKDYN